MLFHMKNEKAKQLESQLNKLQQDGPAAWAKLPEDQLFTPAGFSEERAEATAYSNYSYWGSTFRAFFKNRIAVILLVALVAVVAFAFLQPHLPGQVRLQEGKGHHGHQRHQQDDRDAVLEESAEGTAPIAVVGVGRGFGPLLAEAGGGEQLVLRQLGPGCGPILLQFVQLAFQLLCFFVFHVEQH